jgi:hypothetical protein
MWEQQRRAERPRKPLWLAQLHNWFYWHPAQRGHTARCVERSLMSPALRRYLPDDPLYAFPRSVWEELTGV